MSVWQGINLVVALAVLYRLYTGYQVRYWYGDEPKGSNKEHRSSNAEWSRKDR